MDSIIITDIENFNIAHILECGQIFRYKKLEENLWRVYSQDKTCDIECFPDKYIITSNDCEYYRNYFDLNVDYGQIKKQLKDLPFMSEAIEYGYGIRILRQNNWEMLISFIISANNHIPRIKKIIEAICTNLGDNMGDYYAFPTPQQMAMADEEFFEKIGAGYRARYLATTANAVANGYDLNRIQSMNTADASKELQKLLGVGEKVADCILLFGYYKIDVFPVDTWIKKVYQDVMPDNKANNAQMRKKLLEIYGKNAGYAQQYLFFNKRSNDKT